MWPGRMRMNLFHNLIIVSSILIIVFLEMNVLMKKLYYYFILKHLMNLWIFFSGKRMQGPWKWHLLQHLKSKETWLQLGRPIPIIFIFFIQKGSPIIEERSWAWSNEVSTRFVDLLQDLTNKKICLENNFQNKQGTTLSCMNYCRSCKLPHNE